MGFGGDGGGGGFSLSNGELGVYEEGEREGEGEGEREKEDELPVWNRRNTRNKLVNANGPICTHGYSARYLDSGTRKGKKDEEEEFSNAFV